MHAMNADQKKMLGTLLKKARETIGIGQDEIADMLHLNKKSISTWERGSRNPPRSRITLIAEAYKIPELELLQFYVESSNGGVAPKPDENILPILKAAVASNRDSVTLSDILFLIKTSKKLDALPTSLVRELLKHRK